MRIRYPSCEVILAAFLLSCFAACHRRFQLLSNVVGRSVFRNFLRGRINATVIFAASMLYTVRLLSTARQWPFGLVSSISFALPLQLSRLFQRPSSPSSVAHSFVPSFLFAGLRMP